MQARVHFHGIAALIGTALLTFAGVASAQLNKQETKCANSINKGAAKVAKAQAGDNSACIKDYGRGKIPSAEACITSDPKGKVAKAISKIKTSDCAGGAPSLLPGLETSSSGIGDIMKAKDLNLIHAIFGTDLDVSIVDASVDKPGAGCQAAIAKAAGKCQGAKLSSFNSCKKDKLKAGDTDIESCLGSGTGGIPDPKGKIGKKCENGLGGTVAKKCGGTNNDALFPPCQGQNLGNCIDQKIECEVCQAVNALDGLNRDCDSFDDGLANGSCSFGEFLALSYNVAGLPDSLSGSIPSLYTPIISPLLNGYDLVLVQESWQTPDPNPLAPLRVYHELLVADADHPYKSDPAPAPLGTDPNRPSALVSDGLNRFSQFPFDPVIREAWQGCFGELDNGADCLAQKGFSVAHTTLAAGVTLDIYNLHMEAGNGPEDEQVRDDGVTLLSEFLNAFSAGEAVIVGGDFNLHSDEEPDSTQFQRLLSETGLTDVCDFLGCPEPGRIDKFLFRSNDSLTLTPSSWNFETDVFVTDDGQPLSDHEALAVRFEWSATPASE